MLLSRWAIAAVTSPRGELWAALQELRPGLERQQLCSTEGAVNLDLAASLLEAAGVPWATI